MGLVGYSVDLKKDLKSLTVAKTDSVRDAGVAVSNPLFPISYQALTDGDVSVSAWPLSTQEYLDHIYPQFPVFYI